MRRDNLAKTGYLTITITVLRDRTQEGGWRWMGVPSVKVLIKKIPTMIVTVKIISTVSIVMLITHCSIREPLFTLIESAAFCNTGSGVLDSGDLSSGTEQCLQI